MALLPNWLLPVESISYPPRLGAWSVQDENYMDHTGCPKSSWRFSNRCNGGDVSRGRIGSTAFGLLRSRSCRDRGKWNTNKREPDKTRIGNYRSGGLVESRERQAVDAAKRNMSRLLTRLSRSWRTRNSAYPGDRRMKNDPYPLHIAPALICLAIVLIVWALVGNV